MRIKRNGDGSTTLIHYYRRPDGKATHKRVTIQSDREADIILAKARLIEECSGGSGSLTLRCKRALEHYQDVAGDMGQPWAFAAVAADLGRYRLDARYAYHHSRIVSQWRAAGLSPNTIANRETALQAALRRAVADGLLREMPVHRFETHRQFRDRVWRGDERQRLYNVMAAHGSWLEMPVRLTEKRHLRWQSDLAGLTDEHLVLTGRGAPYIRFRPRKTGGRVPRDTYLPLLDRSTGEPCDESLYAYLVYGEGRPAGCPYLFPRCGTERNGLISKLKPGDWRPVGYPIKHWRWLCSKADIEDLDPHDLNHVGITYMLTEGGFSETDLQHLGIKYTQRAISVYLNLDAGHVLSHICSTSDDKAESEGAVSG